MKLPNTLSLAEMEVSTPQEPVRVPVHLAVNKIWGQATMSTHGSGLGTGGPDIWTPNLCQN